VLGQQLLHVHLRSLRPGADGRPLLDALRLGRLPGDDVSLDRSVHPWTDPRPGDVCASDGGRTRKVTQVSYRGFGDFVGHADRRPFDWVDGVVYEVGNATHTCSAASWATWCRTAVKAGGAYTPTARG
jgi:hypothetical protein